MRAPSFSTAAVLTLAVGIAVNTIAFTLLNSLALRLMPVPSASRVVRVYPLYETGRRGNLFSYQDYLDYRSEAQGFEILAAYVPADVTVGRSSLDSGVVESRPGIGYVVSANYFDLVGLRPSLGRLFGDAGERESHVPSIVISHTMWQRRFGSDPAVLGASLALNGHVFTIVGVAPPGFHLTEPIVADVWMPLSSQPVALPASPSLERRDFAWLLMVGRLQPGVARQAAGSTLGVIARRLSAAYPGAERPRDAAIASGTFFTIDPGLRPIIALVMATVGLVLLIACANVLNLTLARATARQKEIAVRVAIGAGRWRIVRHLVAETMLVAMLAGGVGLMLSVWTLRALYSIGVGLSPFPWTIALSLAPDIRVFA